MPDNAQLILEDALHILPVVLEDREQVNGEKDEVLRDLIARIKRITKKPIAKTKKRR